MQVARTLLMALLVLGTQSVSAACYYVYSNSNQLLYRSQEAPVDLSLPLSESVSKLGPGLSLIFTQSDSACDGKLDMLQNYRSSKAATKALVRTRNISR